MPRTRVHLFTGHDLELDRLLVEVGRLEVLRDALSKATESDRGYQEQRLREAERTIRDLEMSLASTPFDMRRRGVQALPKLPPNVRYVDGLVCRA